MRFRSGARRIFAITGCLLACVPIVSRAQPSPEKPELRIGVVLSASGGAASIGLPERAGATAIGEQLAAMKLPFSVKIVSYDDASDPTKSTNAVRRLIQEDKVDLVVCCTTTPSSLAILDIITASKTPSITLAAAASAVEPISDHKYIFKASATDRLMIERMLDEVARRKAHRLAAIFADDSYGESGLNGLHSMLPSTKIELAAVERVARTDTNFTSQALRIRQSNPDVVYIHTYTPACYLVQEALRRVGYMGPIIQSSGAASAAFLTLGGKSMENTVVVVSPVLVLAQLPADHPMKAALTDFATTYNKRYGDDKADNYSAMGWDAIQLTVHAFGKLVANKADLGDLAARREALRDAIESTKGFVAASGIFSFSPQDHVGLERETALPISEIKDGKFTLPTY
jgi:branched-chain amino acid transport system substrate-binding protein